MKNLEQYQTEFIGFREALKSYIYRIVINKQDAEDIAQETYIRSFKNLHTFKGNSSFKTWVFSIATNIARDNLRARERWGEDWMELVKDAHVQSESLYEKKMQISRNSEHGKFVMKEHINYCLTCVSKTLLLTHQICLLLKEVYEFKISEIMLITGLTEGKVKHAIADSRKDMIRIFDNRCSLINKNGVCHQCTGLNKIYNPKQNAQKEANKIKMVRERRQANHNQLLSLRLQIAKSINPLNAEGRDLHNYLLENSPRWAKAYAKKTGVKIRS